MTQKDKIKLGVALGALVIAGILIVWQLSSGSKKGTDSFAGQVATPDEPRGGSRIAPGKKR